MLFLAFASSKLLEFRRGRQQAALGSLLGLRGTISAPQAKDGRTGSGVNELSCPVGVCDQEKIKVESARLRTRGGNLQGLGQSNPVAIGRDA